MARSIGFAVETFIVVGVGVVLATQVITGTASAGDTPRDIRGVAGWLALILGIAAGVYVFNRTKPK